MKAWFKTKSELANESGEKVLRRFAKDPVDYTLYAQDIQQRVLSELNEISRRKFAIEQAVQYRGTGDLFQLAEQIQKFVWPE